MTTVINTPRSGEDSSGINLVIGVLVVLLAVFLFFVYALPTIRNTGPAQPNGTVDVNVKLPTDNTQPSGTPAPTPTRQD